MEHAIFVKDLSKTFVHRKAQSGMTGAIRSLFNPAVSEFTAVNKLNFAIEPQEKVAFIGPNGAGKSTTIKMLTGILYPTSGEARVLDLVPWQEREQLSYRIGTVFGQRSKLVYQLSSLETFSLIAAIYDIPDALLKRRLKELSDIFELDRLLDTPVSRLSLGERMRCELVASMLHKPDILFLDEPTIGLDLNAKMQIRNLLNRLTEEQGTTLFLTSHDTIDIEKVATRVIVLDQGSLIWDSSLQDLKKKYFNKKALTLVTDEVAFQLELPGIRRTPSEPYHFSCEVDLTQQSIEHVIGQALQKTHVLDITIEDPSMEEIIRDVYAKV